MRAIANESEPNPSPPSDDGSTVANDRNSGKVLTETLRDLERDGIITRTIYNEMPPRVEYKLTALGQTLRGPLSALGRWAQEHIETVLRARDEYDERSA